MMNEFLNIFQYFTDDVMVKSEFSGYTTCKNDTVYFKFTKSRLSGAASNSDFEMTNTFFNIFFIEVPLNNFLNSLMFLVDRLYVNNVLDEFEKKYLLSLNQIFLGTKSDDAKCFFPNSNWIN
jgi:hypothetical protein